MRDNNSVVRYPDIKERAVKTPSFKCSHLERGTLVNSTEISLLIPQEALLI